MVAARNLISAREPNLAAPGGEVAAASGPDPAWLAQAIKVRKLAFRLLREEAEALISK